MPRRAHAALLALLVALPLAAESASGWEAMNALPGVKGEVHASIVYQNRLVIGGRFTVAGDVPVRNLAQWDPATGTWSAVGPTWGPPDTVYALAVTGTTLWVGGTNGLVDGTVRGWNGTAWSSLSLGIVSGDVKVLAAAGDRLYIGGNLLLPNYELRQLLGWNVQTNQPFDPQLDGSHLYNGVTAALVHGGYLYVGGRTNSTVRGAVLRCALGATSWTDLGAGNGHAVLALAQCNGRIYAGGWGQYPATAMLRYWTSGTTWTTVSGIDAGGEIRSLAAVGTSLHVGGNFTITIGGASTNRIATYTGSGWTRFGNAGIGYNRSSEIVRTILPWPTGGDVFVAGSFTNVFPASGGTVAAVNIVRRAPTKWEPLNAGWTSVSAIDARSDTEIYAAGVFSSPTTGMASIARWDGTRWTGIGTKLIDDSFSGVCAHGGSVYVSGYLYDTVRRVYAGVMRWNGTAWSSDLGISCGNGYALASHGGDLLVAGSVRIGTGTSTFPLVRLGGGGWTGDAALTGSVQRIVPLGADLVVTGSLGIPGGGATVARLAAGGTWQPVGPQPAGGSGQATLFTEAGGSAFVGVLHSSANPVYGRLHRLAADAWQPVGDVRGYVNDLATCGGRPVIGGAFSGVDDGTLPVSNIVLRDGDVWRAMAGGTDGQVRVLASLGDSVIVVGDFSTAGGIAAPLIARYALPPPLVPALTSSYTGFPAGGPFDVSVTFPRPVTGMDADDVTVDNGTVSAFWGNGTVFSITVTPTAEGEVVVRVRDAAATDADGYSSTEGTIRVMADLTPPVPLLTSTAPATVTGAFEVHLTFDSQVGGFDGPGDLAVTNGSIASWWYDGAGGWTFQIEPTTVGTVTVTVPAGTAMDTFGRENVARSLSRTFDPPVTVPTLAADETVVRGTLRVGVTFPTAVTGFGVEDLVIVNGTCTGFDGDRYLVAATADGEVRVRIPAGAATDRFGRLTAASATLIATSDTKPPVITLQGPTTLPVTGSFTMTAVASESVSGWSFDDIGCENGLVTDVTPTGTGMTWTVVPQAAGTVTCRIPAGAVADQVGLTNAAVELPVAFTPAAPTVTLTAPGWASGSFEVTVRFSVVVTGFTGGDVTVANGTASGLTGNGLEYRMTITPAGEGPVVITVPADVALAFGLGNAAGTATTACDQTPPVAAVSSTAPAIVGGAFTVKLQFDEPITGLALDDLTVVNGTASVLAGSAATWTVRITPSTAGTVTVLLGEDRVADRAGNLNAAGGALERTYEPSVGGGGGTPATGGGGGGGGCGLGGAIAALAMLLMNVFHGGARRR